MVINQSAFRSTARLAILLLLSISLILITLTQVDIPACCAAGSPGSGRGGAGGLVAALRSSLLFLLQLRFGHYLKGNVFKHILDIQACFRTCCVEFHSVLLCQGASFTLLHFQIRQVSLVRDENAHDIAIGILIDLLEPIANIWESLSLRCIVHQNDSLGTSVVISCDCLEAFLTGCVPQLQLDAFIVNLEHLDLEINPDRRHVVRTKSILTESHQETSLANRRISDENELDQLVVVLGASQSPCLWVATNAFSIIYHFWIFVKVLLSCLFSFV